MKMDDLRDFLDMLDEFEEVQRIKAQVDWNLEMGAITRRCYDIGAPAALFENIKGYPQGFRTLGAPLGASKKPGHSLFARTALALGLRLHAGSHGSPRSRVARRIRLPRGSRRVRKPDGGAAPRAWKSPP